MYSMRWGLADSNFVLALLPWTMSLLIDPYTTWGSPRVSGRVSRKRFGAEPGSLP